MVNSCVRKAMPELTWDAMYEKHCAMNIYAALASVFTVLLPVWVSRTSLRIVQESGSLYLFCP